MNRSGNLLSLRCQLSRSRKVEKCAGTAGIDIDKKCIYLKTPHNHEPNEKSSKIQTFLKRVRKECEKLPTQLHKYKFEEMAEEFCEKEKIDLKEISFSKMKSNLNYARKQLLPPEIPHSIEDVLEAIKKHQDKPVLRYYQETVSYSTNNQNDICSVIFGRRELIDEFEKSTEVGQEGTFKITPVPFSHVYIVTFKYKTHWFPAFVCLMAFKDKSAYTQTFDCIYSNLAPQFQGSKIHLELEPESKEATVSVLKKISIENSNRSYLAKTKLKGCIFYYGFCILITIKRHGLIMKYSRLLPFYKWV